MKIDLLDDGCVFSLNHRCSILISGVFWESVGSYYLFNKLNRNDSQFVYLKHRILVENSISTNKDITGHRVRFDWELIRNRVMYVAVFNKFSQIAEYKTDLLNLFKTSNDIDIIVSNFSEYWIKSKSGLNNYVKILRNVNDSLNY